MSNNPVLTDLLGKHIKELPNYKLRSKLEKVNSYKSNLKGTFLGKPSKELGVITNKLNTITEVSIIFLEVINNTFYKLLVKAYGAPNKILKHGKVISSEVWENNEFKSTKVVSKLEETSFSDNPVLIRWNKEKFSIDVKLNYTYNTTEIVFYSLV